MRNPEHTSSPMPPEEARRALAEFRARQAEPIEDMVRRMREEEDGRIAELEDETAPDDLSDLDDLAQTLGLDEFREADHPRAPDGRFGEKAGEHGSKLSDYKPGTKASGLAASLKLREEWRATAPATVADLTAAAPANHAALVQACSAIAAATGAKFKNPGPKSPERIAEKIARGKTPQQVGDAARGGFLAETPEQARRVVEELGKRFEVADEGFQRTPTGYFDQKVDVRFPDGMIGEVQIWPPGMLEAKGGGHGHDLYEQWQGLPADSPKKGELVDKMTELYAAVAKKLPPAWRELVDSWHQNLK